MAIDPTQINTVQTKDLPPAAINLTDNFAHEVGDILSRATIQELVDFVRGSSSGFKYEIKTIRAPNIDYINDNFITLPGSTQGLGVVGGLWEGWAICNGNNGTDNLDGQALIGYGANYATVGQFLGNKTVVLSPNHIPRLTGNMKSIGTAHDNAGGVFKYIMMNDISDGLTEVNFATTVNDTSPNTPLNMLQPSFVLLMIMKIV